MVPLLLATEDVQQCGKLYVITVAMVTLALTNSPRAPTTLSFRSGRSRGQM